MTADNTTEQTDTHDRDVQGEETSTPNSEAAKYRRRLREAEAERDALRDTVATMQRADAERIAASSLVTPGDLFAAGTDLADLLDDTGTLDADKVTSRCAELVAERPHWAAKKAPADNVAREALRPAVGNPESTDKADSFTAAFAPTPR